MLGILIGNILNYMSMLSMILMRNWLVSFIRITIIRNDACKNWKEKNYDFYIKLLLYFIFIYALAKF